MNPNKTKVGTCSLCGGAVTVHTMWMSVIPDVPTCEDCGATASQHGPVIQMVPRSPIQIKTTDITGETK